MTTILRFIYFSENIVFLRSYYQLSYVSVWLTRVLCTIANILIKSWIVPFNLALDWSNAKWIIWRSKQSLKPYMLNEPVVAITNASCVYLLISLWVFCFFKVPIFNLSPTLALSYTKSIWSRVRLVSCPF